MTDDLARRCARAAMHKLGPERGYAIVAEVVLREAGVAEMVKALKEIAEGPARFSWEIREIARAALKATGEK